MWGSVGRCERSRNAIFHDLSSNWLSMQLELAFAPALNYQQVHLALYQDDDNFMQVGWLTMAAWVARS